MSFIYELHRTMMSNNLVLVYQGHFTQETTKSILTIAERSLETSEEDPTIKRKVFNVVVESLQNIVKHNDDVREGIHKQRAIFLISRESDRYTIMTGNPLHKRKMGTLKSTLDRINKLDKEGLKDLYRDIIQDSTISEKGGAGLGFVDMARKSGEKLGYDFPEMSADFCFFCLKVSVSRDQSS